MRIAGLAHDSIVDGPGLRLTVFFQGCHHHCPGCQNPATWPFAGGEESTVEQLVAQAQESPLCRGVTLSGGDPFDHAAQAAQLAGALTAAGSEGGVRTGLAL